ncbi:MAG TPA: DUF3631 domain-containing protein [Candidatus Binataceae bacterium]|nr:DUF3631 domain-containing protein [Candidatus Binataceae bacterium]
MSNNGGGGDDPWDRSFEDLDPEAARLNKARDVIEKAWAEINADITKAYAPELLDAAALLYADSPGEYAGLRNRLKGKQVHLGRWEREVEKIAREWRDTAAAAAKAASGSNGNGKGPSRSAGEIVQLEEPEPWDKAVDGALLVEDLAAAVRRFVVVDQNARVAISLWVLMTYCVDLFDLLPRLGVTSPDMRCGKSTLLELVSYLVYRALAGSNISPSAIYRAIHSLKPTLLLDEVETYVSPRKDGSGEEIRGVLNSGHSRATAYVIRTGSKESGFAPERFSTFTPMALALIGQLPATLADRSVAIKMKRRTRGEAVERLGGQYKQRNQMHFAELRRRCIRWARDNSDRIAQVDPRLPKDLNDREADNWRVLLQIADVIGPEWGDLARKAAESLAAAVDSASIGTLLLGDLRGLFRQRAGDQLQLEEVELASATICKELGEMEARPWSEWGRHQKPITQRQLASQLKPFSITPGTVHPVPEESAKGYRYRDCKEAFSRYLDDDLADTIRPNVQTTGGVGENDVFTSDQEGSLDGSKNDSSPYAEKDLDVWTDRNGDIDTQEGEREGDRPPAGDTVAQPSPSGLENLQAEMGAVFNDGPDPVTFEGTREWPPTAGLYSLERVGIPEGDLMLYRVGPGLTVTCLSPRGQANEPHRLSEDAARLVLEHIFWRGAVYREPQDGESRYIDRLAAADGWPGHPEGCVCEDCRSKGDADQ